jgi:hypothetical protein
MKPSRIYDRKLNAVREMTIYYKGQKLPVKDGKVGEGIGFYRIRRITGYLVGNLERWNNAKKEEEKDRVKHLTVRREND